MSQEHNIEEIAEQLHCWYLEAVQKIDPNNYNHKAQKPYNELNEDQKFLDRYIAKKVIALHHSHTEQIEQARREEREACAVTVWNEWAKNPNKMDDNETNRAYSNACKAIRERSNPLIST